MVGRDPEIARLDRIVAAAAAGSGGFAVVVGEPGVGKTRLVDEAARGATLAGLSVRVGRALDREVERTLGAALDAFDMRLDQLAGTFAGPGLLTTGAASAAGFLLADRMLEIVESACGAGPVFLAIEDLHWADPATLAWVRSLARRAAELPLALVVTTRPPPPGSAARRTLRLLDPQPIELAPLDPAGVAMLAEAVLGRPPDPTQRAALARTGGSPLLVHAVLAGDAHGQAERAIELRVAELDPEATLVVQAAAIIGAGVHPAQLAAVLRTDVVAVLPHLAVAAAAGLMTADSSRTEFRHELYRRAVLDTVLPATAAALHLAAAQVLARSGAPLPDVAEHFARGAAPGDTEAVDWLVAAASDVAAANPASALRLVDVALDLCVAEPEPELLLARVRALAGAGRADEAIAVARSMLSGPVPPAREAALRRELALASLIVGRAADCVEEMVRCAAVTHRADARARVQGEVAFARFMAVDLDGAATAAHTAVVDGARHGDVVARIAGDAVLCFLDLYALRSADAQRRAESIVALAESAAGADAHVFQPWFIAGLVWLELDRPDRLAATVRRGHRAAVERGAGWAVPGYEALRAFAALRAGDLDDVAVSAAATLGLLRDMGGESGGDAFGVGVWCHAFLAQVLALRGELDRAAAHVDLGMGLVDTARAQLGHEQLALALAAVRERQGDPVAALGAVGFVWDRLRAVGMSSPLPAVALQLVRLSCVTGDRSRVEEAVAWLGDAADSTGTASDRAMAQLARAWRDTDPDAALRVADRAATGPRRVLAAAARADAASLLRTRGRHTEADRTAAAAAREWSSMGADGDADRCLAGTRRAVPAGRRPRFGIAALTGTERHVVALVADGLANAAIAHQLGISRRTVESHVSAVYRKLEVPSRVALTRAALEHGIGVPEPR